MRSSVNDILPMKVRRDLARFGGDIAVARRKRSLTSAMMAERLGVAKSTYLKIEKGDPSVAMASYAMALFVLGFDTALGDLLNPAKDGQGLLLDEARLPKRIRVKRMQP
jgi:DNA-binding XRE family transcriptional regulator